MNLKQILNKKVIAAIIVLILALTNTNIDTPMIDIITTAVVQLIGSQ